MRKGKKASQDDFALVSSRAYISALERGIKNPTVAKVDDLAAVLNIHPLTLLALAYLENPSSAAALQTLFTQISEEVADLNLSS